MFTSKILNPERLKKDKRESRNIGVVADLLTILKFPYNFFYTTSLSVHAEHLTAFQGLVYTSPCRHLVSLFVLRLRALAVFWGEPMSWRWMSRLTGGSLLVAFHPCAGSCLFCFVQLSLSLSCCFCRIVI